MRSYPGHIATALRRFRGEERGAALVELAISLPLLLLVFAVIVVNFAVDLAYAAADPRLRTRT